MGVGLERIQRFDGGELTLVALDAEDFARAGAEESFSEGIVDHLRSIAATKVAVLIRELLAPESRGKRKVSLRATGDDVDVSAIARTQGGGGHRRAAGFSSTLEVHELIELLRRELALQLHPAPNGRTLAFVLPTPLRRHGVNISCGIQTGDDGILLIDKPAGITSHDVVARVRRSLGRSQDGPCRDARPVCHRSLGRARR